MSSGIVKNRRRKPRAAHTSRPEHPERRKENDTQETRITLYHRWILEWFQRMKRQWKRNKNPSGNQISSMVTIVFVRFFSSLGSERPHKTSPGLRENHADLPCNKLHLLWRPPTGKASTTTRTKVCQVFGMFKPWLAALEQFHSNAKRLTRRTSRIYSRVLRGPVPWREADYAFMHNTALSVVRKSIEICGGLRIMWHMLRLLRGRGYTGRHFLIITYKCG